ncbi:NAD(P)-dependent oxidoreductase [Actinomadura decatromicini]|uniref:NAD(P)-dependent oxidoreductase n=1 Tax=Actinomadura decatromicini TaxID=2604572 RepID=A0A5D3FZC7_9ACTN|nr:NAD(P)-dependent oxidoreductase [Actinomadura decatromicini]TYK53080.1 NAD(P)-dependent oxidoreductase [Actinomadura decatromicini]
MRKLKQRVGQVGLGSIGRIYARHLVDAADDVQVFDLDRTRVEAAERDGATGAASARDLAAASEVVVVSLPNPPAVESAFLGTDGILAGAEPGTVVLDLSTVSPDTSRRMHAAAAERGVGYLDAPVSGGAPMNGGVEGAAARTITFMVGGDADAYARAEPVMAALGTVRFHIGPSGSGSAIKLISNLLSGVYALATAEAFALGAAVGLSPERLVEVFQQTDAKSYFMTDYLVPRLLRGDLDPGFSVALQLKDHRLAAELGHEHRVPLFLNQQAIQLYELMVAQGRADRDVTDALPFFAEQAGRPLPASSS